MFIQEHRNEMDLCNVIMDNVRSKLMSLKVKRSAAEIRVAKLWNIKMEFHE